MVLQVLGILGSIDRQRKWEEHEPKQRRLGYALGLTL